MASTMSFHPSSEAAIRDMQAAARNLEAALIAVSSKDVVADYGKLVGVLSRLSEAAVALNTLGDAPRVERDQGRQKADLETANNRLKIQSEQATGRADAAIRRARGDGDVRKQQIRTSSDLAGYRRVFGFVIPESKKFPSMGRFFLAYLVGLILFAFMDLPLSTLLAGLVVPLGSCGAAIICDEALKSHRADLANQRAAIDNEVDQDMRKIMASRDAEVANFRSAHATEQRRIDAEFNDRLKKLSGIIDSADRFLTTKAQEMKDTTARWERQHTASIMELVANGSGGSPAPPALLRLGSLKISA